jgi:exodeoxyribonuclease V gamma subunit
MDNCFMPNFTVFSSNRLEILSDRLAEIVRRPLSSPLEAETIIVQSRGMERWISLALARRNKICANVWYPFPNTFLETMFRRILPDIPHPSPFNREILTFKILKNLSAILDRPQFSLLRRYLADDDNGLKAYKLSLKLADLYDQYLVFRPELILQWDAGQGDDSPDGRWQAELWRILASGMEKKHRAYLQQEFLARLESTPASTSDLPSRVSIFGISYLPPFHLQSFIGLSRIAPVNLFLLSPCREFWADILSVSEMYRLSRKSSSKTDATESLHMEQGHPMLASMGQLGKEFFYLINQYDVHIEDCFESADGIDLLSRLQSDILNLKYRATPRFHPDGSAAVDTVEKIHSETEYGAADGSIQIHSCHSPMREIEVLRDNLLALFEQDADLKPRDVIVMTPDIGAYAPYISAVFDIREGDNPVIPFGIADQSTRRMSPVTRSFLSLLDIPGSRFGASRVLGLLGSAGVKERFGFADAEVETIARWVDHVNIRWGRDAESRKRKGLPGYTDNTWVAGIERLLLGYAMPGHDRARMFSGILPYDHIEGGEAQILGRFLEFLSRLFEFSVRLDNALSPAAWQSVLSESLNSFIAIDESTERDIQYLHSCLGAFGRLESLTEFSEPLAFEVVRAHIENKIDGSYGEGGFLSGGVTFCAMLPMRSIPFEVVCLIGLGADAFPRDDHPLGFDLITRHPRAGDRSRRKDDKYLFLEALISARRNLYISYVGQSVQDNSHIPPSVLVTELIENIAKGFGLSEGDLVVRHPLQAYSKRYFVEKEPSLFSYSRENFIAAAVADEASAPPPFFSEPLSGPPAEFRTLRLEHLCQFFAHPVRYLTRWRLRLHFEEPEQRSEDKENFNLEALGRYHLKQELLSARLSGHDLRDYFYVQKAKGDLPLGTVGRVLYEKLEQDAKWFAEEISEFISEETSECVPIDMAVGKFRLQGTLGGLYRQGRIQARFARRRAKDWLSVWIYHLVLCSLKGHPHPAVSILIDTDGAVRFKPVKRPEAVLRDLLENYLEGLRRPLHFFPELSYGYVKMVGIEGKKPEAAYTAVRKQWSGSDYRKGVSEDPYYRLCFGGSDPFDDEFQFLAQKVFSPLLAHAEISG